MANFTYVVAVDFEATCWENQPSPLYRKSEIIEFPAVLINLKTGQAEAEFHKYIQPVEKPILSKYCLDLTGITQQMVDSGISLQEALQQFHKWLREVLRARDLVLPKMNKANPRGNCAMVTWSNWDFGICLDKECSRKKLLKPEYFNQWVDVRYLYMNFYRYRPTNFEDALCHVGLKFEGRAHSGIVDAKNLGTLVCKMVRDGIKITITKDLKMFQPMNLNCEF